MGLKIINIEFGDSVVSISFRREDSSKIEGRFKESFMHGLARRLVQTAPKLSWQISRIEVKKFRTFRQQVTWLGRFKRGRPCGRWGKCWYFFLLPVFVLIERIQSTYLGICYKLEPKQGLILMRTIRRQDILTFWQGPGSGKREVDGWLDSQSAMAELQV